MKKEQTHLPNVTARNQMTALYLENAPQIIWCIEQQLGGTVKPSSMLDSQRTLKKRYSAHKQNFENPEQRTKTTLAGHIWKLKDKNITPEVSWEVVCRAAPFSPVTGVCNLCTSEKWNIIFKSDSATLNKRQELFNHCRHKESLLLVKKQRPRPRLRPPGD